MPSVLNRFRYSLTTPRAVLTAAVGIHCNRPQPSS
ncbi:hypothetical protein ACVW0B_002948, partial [Thermostichus sp. MS-CIW-23]